jgi:hypothetical protein
MIMILYCLIMWVHHGFLMTIRIQQLSQQILLLLQKIQQRMVHQHQVQVQY